MQEEDLLKLDLVPEGEISSMDESFPSGNAIDPEKENHSESDKTALEELITLASKELSQRKEQLNNEIIDLNNRKLKIENEFKANFSGQSDEIARKVKGFQDYLTGALQDLAQSAEQLELVVQPMIVKPSPLDKEETIISENTQTSPIPIAETFKPDEELIKECLDQFLSQPDFYAEPWKFRRSLNQKDINILSDWFFNQGGRGAQPSMGTRSKNIILSAGLISILGELYGDRFQTLVLASQPERLGEWRRGLQDALGLNREDFGPNSGIVLFERSDALVERADRLESHNEVPMILIDSGEGNVGIPVLQFPLWLAFAATPEEIYEDEQLL